MGGGPPAGWETVRLDGGRECGAGTRGPGWPPLSGGVTPGGSFDLPGRCSVPPRAQPHGSAVSPWHPAAPAQRPAPATLPLAPVLSRSLSTRHQKQSQAQMPGTAPGLDVPVGRDACQPLAHLPPCRALAPLGDRRPRSGWPGEARRSRPEMLFPDAQGGLFSPLLAGRLLPRGGRDLFRGRRSQLKGPPDLSGPAPPLLPARGSRGQR